MTDSPIYAHLEPGGSLPNFTAFAPYRALVVVDAPVTPEWQARVSERLVESGCLYLVAWGRDCTSWDTSVDVANLEVFDYGDIPEERFVMTTWHADEPLTEALFFSKHCASHPTVELRNTVLLHIAPRADEARMLAAYAEA